MFDASAGLLLENGLHKAFDTLDWSLYLKVGESIACRIIAAHMTEEDTYHVHYFIPTAPEHFQLHGKAIPPERFGRFYDPPDSRLIAWHYRQAVQARIRGYSVGMNPRNKG